MKKLGEKIKQKNIRYCEDRQLMEARENCAAMIEKRKLHFHKQNSGI